MQDCSERGGVYVEQEELWQGNRGHADGPGVGDTDVIDLGVALKHANAESQRNIKLVQGNIRIVQTKFEEETKVKAVATDNLISGDRRSNANQNALEEARTLEQADRNRRMVEQELADTNKTLSDLTCQNQTIQGAKQKCEQHGP